MPVTANHIPSTGASVQPGPKLVTVHSSDATASVPQLLKSPP